VTNSFNITSSEFTAVNVQLNNVSATRKTLVVTLDAAEVDAEHSAVVGEISKYARIPGFRPGKAPAAMVARRFGKEIADEFKQKVVGRAYRDGLEKEKIDVLNVVNVEEGKIEAGQPVSVTITLDVRPEFALPDYNNLKTELAPVEPTDAEVEDIIQGLRAERADFKPAERPAQKGDYVKLGYEGTIDGKPVVADGMGGWIPADGNGRPKGVLPSERTKVLKDAGLNGWDKKLELQLK
jgi:trigger factor